MTEQPDRIHTRTEVLARVQTFRFEWTFQKEPPRTISDLWEMIIRHIPANQLKFEDYNSKEEVLSVTVHPENDAAGRLRIHLKYGNERNSK